MNEITNILLKDANIRKLLNKYKMYVIGKYECALNGFLNFKKQFDSTPESQLENFAPEPGIKVSKHERNAYMLGGYHRLLFKRYAEWLEYNWSKSFTKDSNSDILNSFSWVYRHSWLWPEQQLTNYIERRANEHMMEAAETLANFIVKKFGIPSSVELKNAYFQSNSAGGLLHFNGISKFAIYSIYISFHGGDLIDIPFNISFDRYFDIQ